MGSADADYMMREVHEGIYKDHGRGRALAHKIIKKSYFWPTMHEDARELVQRCDECQKFAAITRKPLENMAAMSSAWPVA